MPSKTEIANGALVELGVARLTNVDTDNTAKSQAVLDVYDEVLHELLRSHNWNFATKRVQLARSSNTPAYEFDYAYPLPTDWLRTISVSDNDAGYGTFLHRVEWVGTQRCVVTSADQVYMRYVYDLTDGNKFPGDFVRAFQYALARSLAIKFTDSRTLRTEMDAALRKQITAAKSVDAMGASPELRPRGSWAGSRNGYRNDDFLND